MHVSIIVTNSIDEAPSIDTILSKETLYIHNDDEALTMVLKELHYRYATRAIEVYGGRNRNVFRMKGGYVVKLPSCMDGIADNDWEGSVSNSPDSIGIDTGYVQYARTRMGMYKEVPIVFMEYVEFTSSKKLRELYGEEPDWCFSVDCGQVGFNKIGRLVAFDYGCK